MYHSWLHPVSAEKRPKTCSYGGLRGQTGRRSCRLEEQAVQLETGNLQAPSFMDITHSADILQTRADFVGVKPVFCTVIFDCEQRPEGDPGLAPNRSSSPVSILRTYLHSSLTYLQLLLAPINLHQIEDQPHMSTLEQCGSAMLHSSDLSHTYEDLDEPRPSTCSICYQALSWDTTASEAENPAQLACGHIFGASCIQTWAMFNATCPMCRAEFDLDSHDANAVSPQHHQIENERSAYNYASEYLEMRDISNSPASYDSEEDMWLAVAREEANARCRSRKRLFSAYEDDDVKSDCSAKRHRHVDWVSPDGYPSYSKDSGDVSFDELIHSHEEWMTSDCSLKKPEDEFAISYYDVLV